MSEKDIVAAELAALYSAKGILLPEDVIEAAKPKTSPLHNLFDWNNKSAAHKYRVEQARALIRSVRTTYITEKRSVSAVVYIHDPEERVGYTRLADVHSDTDKARDIIAREVKSAYAAVQRAREIARALEGEDDLHRSLQELDGMVLRILEAA